MRFKVWRLIWRSEDNHSFSQTGSVDTFMKGSIEIYNTEILNIFKWQWNFNSVSLCQLLACSIKYSSFTIKYLQVNRTLVRIPVSDKFITCLCLCWIEKTKLFRSVLHRSCLSEGKIYTESTSENVFTPNESVTHAVKFPLREQFSANWPFSFR
jgi:hypothetical protein